MKNAPAILSLKKQLRQDTTKVNLISDEILTNYPNPFNPTTIIQYNVLSFGKVVLKVYDLLGREVATLVDKQQNAGQYSVFFNASRLSSGVYFYKIQAGSYTETKKMMLIK